MGISSVSTMLLVIHAISTIAVAAPIPESACEKLTAPDVPGLTILSISGTVRKNFSVEAYNVLSPTPLFNLNFCDAEIVVTRPGVNDRVRISVWLPFSDWNGRFQGQGGGGFATENIGPDGKLAGLALAVSNGYAGASSDGGHIPDPWDPSSWALDNANEVNWPLLMNFASRSLHDMTLIGKAVTTAFYGKSPAYSYYNSCSTGGRHGLALAQRYPNDYNGISANAPSLYYPTISVAGQWAQVLMQEAKTFPAQCEFEAFMNASVIACDDLDGVVDGVIDDPSQCFYDARDLIGTVISCGRRNITISETTARLMNRIWDGPRTQAGTRLWYGVNKGTNVAVGTNTTQTANGTIMGYPNPLSNNWITYFVKKNPKFDYTTITLEGFEQLVIQSRLEYDNILATDNPDLSAFQAAGGKMISWHGLVDELIPANGTVHYRQRVNEVMGNNTVLDDFYRVFLAPGVRHCGGGLGPAPVDPLSAIVAWVEEGSAPDVLPAAAVSTSGVMKHRNICRYPFVSRYDGKGDINVAASYRCVLP